MDIRFLIHNSHLENAKQFTARDPQLSRLKKQEYIYESPILDQLPINVPGIYTLSGGRQIGKTTLLKQWMAKLLKKGTPPQSIIFLSGELINDHHALLNLLMEQLALMQNDHITYLIIDEITYIKDWDKAIKYAADAGLLDQSELLITGSDITVIHEARMRLPGRRGKAKKVDFNIYPLTFREVVNLKMRKTKKKQKSIDELFSEFKDYLKHGGYLTAINDYAKNDRIFESTLNTYSDWIRGDVLKRGKHEHYLREILSAIFKSYGSQITWHTLARDLSIDHHKTVADYVALLELMEVLFVQSSLMEDKLTAAPKKARKLFFTDPFIFHAIRYWLFPVEDPFNSQICAAVDDFILSSKIVEACVVTHYRHLYPTYYIKSEGEVDIAYVDKKRFWPVEIKWTNQLHSKDLRQVSKYNNSLILTKNKQEGKINGVSTKPLPLVLMQLKENSLGSSLDRRH